MTFTNRGNRINRLVLGALALGAAATLVSCAATQGSPSTDAPSGELTAITVATLPTSNLAAIHLGIQEGFFEEEGLDVTTQDVQSGSDMITGLLSGTFDFACAGYIPFFTAASQGLPIRIIAGNDVGGRTPDEDWQVTLTGANSPVTSVEDLQTATVGVNQLKGVAEIAVRASLQEQGYDDAKVEFVEIPFPEMPAALASGTIEAAYAPEPFISSVIAAGGAIVDTPSAVLGEGFPNGAWGSSLELTETAPDLVASFNRAMAKSLDLAADDSDAVRAIIPTYTQVPVEVASEMRLPVFTPELDRAQLERLLELMQTFGVIETVPTWDEIVYEPEN
ncbi:MAG TPA: ABC transporter substrate-binding protein [Microbacterium sp.]|uniref:ABC transporter substrate-binding protein n=1 Tax=Microbacterium sp. TaxID=51671 RepID=UPI002B86ACCC|nr:ABC transporter substrate-binding protein [Microbacterium sp.]HWI30949.1 ABC transporter substrate-binding protein [Microbacterium sp.]